MSKKAVQFAPAQLPVLPKGYYFELKSEVNEYDGDTEYFLYIYKRKAFAKPEWINREMVGNPGQSFKGSSIPAHTQIYVVAVELVRRAAPRHNWDTEQYSVRDLDDFIGEY